MSKAQELLDLVEEVVDLNDFEEVEDEADVEYVDGEICEETDFKDLDGDFILEDILDEARRVRVVRVRDGKIQRIQKIICPPGYRATGDKCVKMSAKERAARKRAAKKASKKAHTAGAARKRLKSINKARSLGLTS